MNDTPLRPWIIPEKGGKIISAHCDCMASLGEACTHIAATLLWVDATVRIRETKTATQEKAYWMLPTCVKNIGYSHYRILTLHQQRVRRYCWTNTSTMKKVSRGMSQFQLLPQMNWTAFSKSFQWLVVNRLFHR